MKSLRVILSFIASLVIGGLGGAGLSGCGGATGELAVGLTDAATDQYNAVYVTIDEVQVHKADDAEDSWTVVATPQKTFNLLVLVNGVREELGIATLSTGSYTQMRLILGEGDEPDDGINILGESHPFANYVIDTDNEIHELKVPSGFQTGIKIVQGFEINENETTELILDFDASQSVVIAGNSGQYLLKPTIKVLETVEASIVSGHVTNASDTSAVAGASVSAQSFDPAAADKKDEVTVQAATISNEEGLYSLFVASGTYNLVAYKTGFEPSFTQMTLTAGETFTQDFALIPIETGNVVGEVSIAGGGGEDHVTISFRRSVLVGTETEKIELGSIHVANGGIYDVSLPSGEYEAVSSTFGKTTQSATIVVVAGFDTTHDIAF